MLPKSFFRQNREELLAQLPEGSALLIFSGSAPRQSADAEYPFFANRNFVYLTGMEEAHLIYLAVKDPSGCEESIFLQEEDEIRERWFGRSIHASEVEETYGAFACRSLAQFEDDLHALSESGRVSRLWLDLDPGEDGAAQNEADKMAERAAAEMPQWEIENAHPLLCDLRTIKKPCEIEAMRRSAEVTKAGIEAMMSACRPGMREYQLKAEFDYALAQKGVLTPAFPSIVCAGENNFCLHYYSYTGEILAGDMVLSDVGAWWDGECSDVSRTWPANGIFTERQRALYQCIYRTSEHMFSVIRPGMPMRSIDEQAREFCFEELKKLGLIENFRDIRSFMWHDGAHHVGFDVHDAVNYSRSTEPGMVFCVDIGVYCREWGIGFRLEDNCLVTETGCINLTAAIPRSIEEIERFMRENDPACAKMLNHELA